MKKILILGAGRVGSTIASQLASENEVTIVDNKPRRLRELRERIDARTLSGSAEVPAVLDKAGAGDADIVLAVTELDAVNITACQICRLRFDSNGVQKRIARIRNSQISNDLDLLGGFGVSQSFCPEDIITDSILGTISHPGVSKVASFAGGCAEVAVVHMDKKRALTGRTLGEMHQLSPDLIFDVVAIRRGEMNVVHGPDTRLHHDDQVVLVADAGHTMQAVGLMQGASETNGPARRVAIAGGGNVGARLAARLEANYQVILIEHDRARCSELTQNFERTLVLHGDATDEGLLLDEEIGTFGFFCAVTEHDEVNIMSALLARQLGVGNIAVMINRSSYMNVLKANNVDVVISPSMLTVGALLTHVRERPFEMIHTLDENGAAVIEFFVHDAADKLLGRRLSEVTWPAGTRACALIRPESGNDAGRQGAYQMTVLSGGAQMAVGDHLLLYVSSPDALTLLERMLSASPLA